MTKEQEFWDKRAKDYGKQTQHIPQYNEAITRTKKLLNTEDILLDYGCGPGLLTVQLSENVKRIHAIDFSSKMIEVAQYNAEEKQIKNVLFEPLTVFDNKLLEESFSVVTAFNILHLLDNPSSAIKRINELLKPGGLFVSETVCLGYRKAIARYLLFFLNKIGLIPYINYFKKEEFEDIIKESGFQIVESEFLKDNPPISFIVARKL